MLSLIQLDLCLMNLAFHSDKIHFSSSLVNERTKTMFIEDIAFIGTSNDLGIQ